MPRLSLMNVATALMCMCALMLTGLVVRREFAPSRTEGQVQSEPSWREYASTGLRLGPRSAPIHVTEFSDFQCPFCAVAAKNLRALQVKYPGQITIGFRQFPLPFHTHAWAAARGAICAAEQQAFEGYHDFVFARQDSLGALSWGEVAHRGGVPDTVVFMKCLVDTIRLDARIAMDTAAGARLKVRGTPTLLVNDQVVRGSPQLAELEAIVAKARKWDATTLPLLR